MERIPFGVTLALVKGGTGTYDSELSGVYPVVWKKRAGEMVLKGEEIASVEADKVTLAVHAPISGRIATIFQGNEWNANGTAVETPYGIVLAPPLGEIETAAENIGAAPLEKNTEHVAERKRVTPLAKKIAAAEGVDITALHGTGVGGRIDSHDVARALDEKAENVTVPQRAESIRAVPASRALASEKGIDIASVSGSGEDGLVLLRDVEKKLAPITDAQVRTHDSGISPVAHTSAVRKTIARLLTRSWKEITHAGDTLSVDMTALMEFIGQYNSVTAPFTGTELRLDYLVAWYARELLKSETFRAVNGYWDAEKEEAVLLDAVNIGFAVDTEYGLVIPVVHDTGDKKFSVFVKEAHDAIEKARRGALRVSDMRDLSFTVNNSGILGGENPASIIPYAIAGDGTERPTAMILSLARIRRDRKRSVLPLVFRFDHRLFDGREAVAFVRTLRERIESKKLPQEFADDLSGKKRE